MLYFRQDYHTIFRPKCKQKDCPAEFISTGQSFLCSFSYPSGGIAACGSCLSSDFGCVVRILSERHNHDDYEQDGKWERHYRRDVLYCEDSCQQVSYCRYCSCG